MTTELETVELDGATVERFPLTPAPKIADRKISKGAFQLRLGPLNVFAIDNNSHPVCIALRAYLSRLNYVDLADPQTDQMLYMLVHAEQPEANPAFPGSGPITGLIAETVLMTPVEDHERP